MEWLCHQIIMQEDVLQKLWLKEINFKLSEAGKHSIILLYDEKVYMKRKNFIGTFSLASAGTFLYRENIFPNSYKKSPEKIKPKRLKKEILSLL